MLGVRRPRQPKSFFQECLPAEWWAALDPCYGSEQCPRYVHVVVLCCLVAIICSIGTPGHKCKHSRPAASHNEGGPVPLVAPNPAGLCSMLCYVVMYTDRSAMSVAILPMSVMYNYSNSVKGAIARYETCSTLTTYMAYYFIIFIITLPPT